MDALHTRAFLDEVAEIYAADGLEKEAAIFQNLLRQAKAGGRLAGRQVQKADKVFRNASIKAYVHAPEHVKKIIHGTEKVVTDPDNLGTAAAGTLLSRFGGR